jgi:hypothetical protein
MRAKIKFMRMFDKLPKEARNELIYDFTFNPMTLNVIMAEIKNDTKLGKEILKNLGYKDTIMREWERDV